MSVARKADGTPPFCGLEGALKINFILQPVSRASIAIFVWNISFKKDKNPSSNDLFSTVSVFLHSCSSDEDNNS